jgi:hypothetical protein
LPAYWRPAPSGYHDCDDNQQETAMSMQNEGKDAKGRNWDQVTKDGSSSAGSMGVAGTGDVADLGHVDVAGKQQATRTDDLLTDGSESDQDGGFVGEEAGELQTGMAGIGSLSTGNAGNRQSVRDDTEAEERNGTDGAGYSGSSAGSSKN